jgi:hypothetical protein
MLPRISNRAVGAANGGKLCTLLTAPRLRTCR